MILPVVKPDSRSISISVFSISPSTGGKVNSVVVVVNPIPLTVTVLSLEEEVLSIVDVQFVVTLTAN